MKFNTEISIEKINSIVARSQVQYSVDLNCPFTVESSKLRRTYVLSGDSNSVLKIGNQLKKYIEYIEPIPQYEFFYTPNDLNSSQWNLSKINAELAWDESTGNGALIAIVDDAVEISHSDLNANIWTNPNEIAGNGIDDDGNGFIDDLNGWDVANGDNDPSPPSTATSSYFAHGTHCAGIASVVTDNNNGISSIGFNAKIVPVKIGDDANSMLVAAYSGVNYAIEIGADVISMSWGGGAYSITYQTIFDYAYSQGITCVAAAGNSNTSTPMYPASYNHVISVGSTDISDSKSSFSNYGPTIDVMAPGSSIFSTVPNNSYGFKSGTSMACPLVSGIVALMISKNAQLTPDEIEQCLASTCDNIDVQNPSYVGNIGGGRVNAYAALQCIKPIHADFSSNAIFTCVGGQIQFTDQSNNNPTSWQWSFPGGSPSSSTLQNPIISYSTPGTYNVELIVQNIDGSDTLVLNNYITVDIPSAQISGSATIIQGAAVALNFNFTGNPPFNYVYTDGTSNYTVSGVTNYTDQQIVTPSSTTTYTLVSMSDADCQGTINGSATINLIPGGSSNCGTFSISSFHKEFETNFHDEARAIYPTSDGGCIIMAASNSGFGQRDYSLFKLDSSYNIEWSRSIGTSGDEGFTFCDITEDGQGNYLIIGTTKYSSSRRESELIKIDGLGNIIFAAPLQQINTDQYNEIIVRSNGNYLVVGSTNNVIGSSDFLIVEYSSTGILIQSKAFGTTSNDHTYQVHELQNGNIQVIASTESGPGARAGLLTIFDSNLNIISNNSYNFTSNREWFTSAIYKPNGNLLIQGRGKSPNERMLLTEISTNGSVVWSKSTPISGNLEPTGIVELSNGTYGVSWTVKNGSTQEFYVASIDDLGNIIWAKKLPTTSSLLVNHTDNLITTSNDGGILLVTYGENSSSLINNINLFKFDVCGNLGCGEIDQTLTVNNESITVTNIPFTSANAGTLISTPHSEQTIISSETVICNSIPINTCNLNADFSIVQSSCLADSVYFTDISYNSSGNINYWHWNLGDGTILSGDSIISHQYITNGNYDVELIIGTDEQCYDTIVQTIAINNIIGITLNDTTICLNDSIQIIPEFSCLPDSISVLWSPSTGLNNPMSLYPIASPVNSTNYTLTITDEFGNTFSSNFALTVNSSCCISYPDFLVQEPICIGDTLLISDLSSTNGSTTYNWSFGPDAAPSSFTGPTPIGISYSSSGTQQIQLVISDDCGLDTVFHQVYVNEAPIAEIISDTTKCYGDTVYLGGDQLGNLIYQWNPASSVSDSSASNPYVIVDTADTYSVEVTDPYTGCSAIQNVTVTGEDCPCLLYPNYLVDTLFCIDDSTNLIDLSVNLYGNLNYRKWDMGDGTIIYGDSAFFYNYSLPGTYTIELTIGLDTLCYDSISQQIIVVDKPLTPLINDTVTCINDTIFLGFDNDSSLNYSWHPSWIVSDSTSSNPFVIVDSLLNIQLEVINSIGCKNTSSVKVTGIDCECKFFIPNVFTPNYDGANEWFAVNSINCDVNSMKVYNRWGQLLFIGNEVINKWDGRTADGQAVPEGTYYYIIEINGINYSGAFTLFR